MITVVNEAGGVGDNLTVQPIPIERVLLNEVGIVSNWLLGSERASEIILDLGCQLLTECDDRRINARQFKLSILSSIMKSSGTVTRTDEVALDRMGTNNLPLLPRAERRSSVSRIRRRNRPELS
jgi:hypothetical protein